MENLSDKIRRKHPWLWRWELFKVSCTECLAKRFNIHIDW